MNTTYDTVLPTATVSEDHIITESNWTKLLNLFDIRSIMGLSPEEYKRFNKLCNYTSKLQDLKDLD